MTRALAVLLLLAGCSRIDASEGRLPEGMNCGPPGEYAIARCYDARYGIACYTRGGVTFSCARVADVAP